MGICITEQTSRQGLPQRLGFSSILLNCRVQNSHEAVQQGSPRSKRSKLGQVVSYTCPNGTKACLPGRGDLEAWAEGNLASETGVETEPGVYLKSSTSVADVERPRRKAQGRVCIGRSGQGITVCSLPPSWGRTLPTLYPGQKPQQCANLILTCLHMLHMFNMLADLCIPISGCCYH